MSRRGREFYDANTSDLDTSIESRMLERDGIFNRSERKRRGGEYNDRDIDMNDMNYDVFENPYEAPYEPYGNTPLGEITGSSYNMTEMDRGMPVRPSFREHNGPDDSNDYTTDFFLHSKTSNLDVQYFDPMGMNDDTGGMAPLSQFSTSILDRADKDPLKALKRTNNELAHNVFDYVTERLEGVAVANMMLTAQLLCLYLVSNGETRQELKYRLSLADQKSVYRVFVRFCNVVNNIPSLRACNIMVIPSNAELSRETADPIIEKVNLIYKAKSRNSARNVAELNSLTAEHSGIRNMFKNDPRLFYSVAMLSTTNLTTPWKTPFNAQNTVQKVFYGKQRRDVYMMRIQRTQQLYYEDHYSKLVELPLLDHRYTYGFMIPKHNKNIKVEEALLRSYIDKLTPQDIDMISIPRFQQKTQYKLNNLLKDMDIQTLFENLDISSLIMGNRNHNLTHLVINTVITVNEGGVSKDKISAIRGLRHSSTFNANVPFVWYLRYVPDNLILALGKYE